MSAHPATDKLLKLVHARQRLEVNDADLSASSFINVKLAGSTFDDVNLSGTSINNANLSHLSVTDSCIAGMTIDGVLVSDLQAAYRAARLDL